MKRKQEQLKKQRLIYLFVTLIIAIILHMLVAGGILVKTDSPSLPSKSHGIIESKINGKRLVEVDKDKMLEVKEIQPLSYDGNEWQEFVLTAYLPTCNGCSGITYTGVDVRNTIYYKGYRVVAVDPHIVPLYSIIRIKLNNKVIEAIALDIGSAINGNDLDLLVNDYERAMEIGRMSVSAKIIRWGG
jgi:3D (Asp-Asp-Asp) domain-containing protein